MIDDGNSDGMIDIGGMIAIHGMIVETQNFASLPNNPGKPDMIDDGNSDGMIDFGGMIAIHGMIVETQNFASLQIHISYNSTYFW